jgi:hypothetical protein
MTNSRLFRLSLLPLGNWPCRTSIDLTTTYGVVEVAIYARYAMTRMSVYGFPRGFHLGQRSQGHAVHASAVLMPRAT